MSRQIHTSFRQTIQSCREFDGEAVYTCLESFVGEGGGDSERTVKEVLIRSLGIHVISLATYGHLMSLQGIASARSCSKAGFVMIIAFFLVPEVAVAQFVWGVWRGILSWFQRRQRPCSFWYCIATTLGAHISIPSMDTNTVPLHKIDPANLYHKSMKYDILWFGRFILLLLLTVQYVGSLGIRYRTYTVYADRWNSFGSIDGRNFHLALGGLTSVLNSILLVSTNLTWHHEPAEGVQLNPTASAHQDINTESPPLSGSLPTAESVDAPLCPSVSLRWKLEKYSNIFTARLEHFFPVTQQRFVEGAVILFTIADAPNWLVRYFNPHFLDLSMIIKEKNPNTSNIESLPVFEYSAAPSLGLDTGGPYLQLRGFLDIYMAPYICSMLIIVSFLIRLFAENAGLRTYIPQKMRRLLVFCNKWITGGRSLTSFPCVFLITICLMGWYDLYGIWLNCLSARRFAQLSRGTHWERLHAKAYMFKDPWYDNMYII